MSWFVYIGELWAKGSQCTCATVAQTIVPRIDILLRDGLDDFMANLQAKLLINMLPKAVRLVFGTLTVH